MTASVDLTSKKSPNLTLVFILLFNIILEAVYVRHYKTHLSVRPDVKAENVTDYVLRSLVFQTEGIDLNYLSNNFGILWWLRAF